MELGKFIPAICMLLGLVESSTAVDQDCNYAQEVEPGVIHYVFNPNYPDYYAGRHSCIWKVTSQTRLKLNCNLFQVPGSRNCSMDAMYVQVGNDIEYVFCGINSFVLESVSTEMIIRFRSNYATYGGRFQCELTAMQEDCQCGWKNPSRIVGGVETGVNEFPMMAGLVDFNRRLLYCGGTIITEKHVLTAAHCVYDYVNYPDTLGIIVGEHDTKRGDETDATQLYAAENIFIHPEYKRQINDVAVVESSQRFKFSMKVGPVCLPFYYTRKDFTNDSVTALGWGTLSYGGKKSTTLMKVNLNVISLASCSSDYTNITTSQICTYTPRKDSCQFDSGGPILWQNVHSNHVILLGVINYGRTCADEYPGISARVSDYLDFIQSVTPEYNYCKMY